MKQEEIIERRKKIFDMRESGMTYKDIAKIYGVTQERVRQLYLKQVRINEYEKSGYTGWGYWK